MPRTRRIFAVLWLVAGLCLQGFATAGEVTARGRDGDAAHAALHLEGVAHHHGEDGSIHKDDSKKSVEHLQADCCVQVPGVLPQGVAAIAAMSPPGRSRAELAAQAYDPPFLEGLRRPPR